jgi:hypothetical protein
MSSLEAVQQVLCLAWLESGSAEKLYDLALPPYGFRPMLDKFFNVCEALHESHAAARVAIDG